MNIKEEIGRRIFEARKAKELTRKALAGLTDDVKPSSINNWERGDRTPGPEEVKQLAKVLDVSPAYLMCLTNQKQFINKVAGIDVLIPCLDKIGACNPIQSINIIKNGENHNHVIFIPLSQDLSSRLSEYTFALKILDDSMDPELRMNDILIVDPNKEPQPGSFVVAKVEDSTEVIVRRYKQLSASKHNQQFELLAMNKHWADVTSETTCVIIGTVCCLNRVLE